MKMFVQHPEIFITSFYYPAAALGDNIITNYKVIYFLRLVVRTICDLTEGIQG